ncbi:MAG: DUF58 domain-containing protein [Aeromicrobium sp.]
MAATKDPAKRLKRAAQSVVLTGRGRGFLIGALVSVVAAHVFTVPAFNYVASLLIGLMMCASIFVFAGHSRVHIDRSFSPDVVLPGQYSTAMVAFENLSMLPSLEAQWQDKLPAGVAGEAHGELRALGSSRGIHSRTKFSYVVHGVRRGKHAIGPLTVKVPDPFGLVLRKHTFGELQHLIVLPKRVDLADISFGGANIAGATRPAPQHVGVGDDDVIARSYLPGDALRRMHWKATAHRGELMVRQEEQRNNPEATVLLDLDALGQGTVRDTQGQWEYSPGFEWSIVAAASVVAHLCRRGYLVNVITPGGSVHRSIADGMDTMEDVMADLAVLEPTEVTVEDIVGVAPGERPVVAVLGRIDDAKARAWSRLNTSTGLAFVAVGTPPEAIEILNSSGWISRTYRAGDDVADLWLDLDARQFHAAR